MTATKEQPQSMWRVPDSGLMPEQVDCYDDPLLFSMLEKKTGLRYMRTMPHGHAASIGYSLFYSEQDALRMQIDNIESFIRDRERKLAACRRRLAELT